MMTSCINKDILAELTEIMGDDLNQLLTTFLQDCELKISQLSLLLEQGDNESLRRIAHSIKGSCKNVGAVIVAKNCEELEFSAKNHKLLHGNEQIKDISDSFQEVKKELKSQYSC